MPFHRAYAVRLNYAASCQPVPADLYMLQYQETSESEPVLLHRVHIPAELRFWFDEAQRYKFQDFGFHVESLGPHRGISAKLPGQPDCMVTGVRMGRRTEAALPQPVVATRRFWWAIAALAGVTTGLCYWLAPDSLMLSGGFAGVALSAWATQHDLPRAPF